MLDHIIPPARPLPALALAIEALDLTLSARFVPWSRSGQAEISLNWVLTIRRRGRIILTADYSLGIEHCPANRAPPDFIVGEDSPYLKSMAALEAESGRIAGSLSTQYPPIALHQEIMPSADALAAIIASAAILDIGSFEAWAAELGYNEDSRKAEAIYRARLAQATKFRNGVGEEGLGELRAALVQDTKE